MDLRMKGRYLLICLLFGSSAITRHHHLVAADLMMQSSALSDNNVEYGVLYPMLGKNSLEEVDYNYTLEVDDDCNYNLTVYWKQNPAFPVGGPDTCLPSLLADYDGNSMLEGRWFYEEYPQYVQDAIDINHLSLDWNPCGHPSGGFFSPHYDVHFYRVSPEYRALKMNCEQISGTPACWPDQYYEEGQKFFNWETTKDGQMQNMPPNFQAMIHDGIVHMGMHAFEPGSVPEDPSKWIDPFYVLLTHDYKIICVEPMLPFHYVIGDVSQYKEQYFTYVDQNDVTLPSLIISKYDGVNTKVTSVSLNGKSKVCKTEFEAAKAAYESMNMSSSNNAKHTLWSFLATSSLTTLLMLWSGGFLR